MYELANPSITEAEHVSNYYLYPGFIFKISVRNKTSSLTSVKIMSYTFAPHKGLGYYIIIDQI